MTSLPSVNNNLNPPPACGRGPRRVLTLSWAEGPVLTSQMVGTWLRLSAGRKSGVSAMSERESTDEEKMEALESSSRYVESCETGGMRSGRRGRGWGQPHRAHACCQQEPGARPAGIPRTHDAQAGNPTREATRGVGPRLGNVQDRLIHGREGGSWGRGRG